MGLGWIAGELQGKQPKARQALVPGLYEPPRRASGVNSPSRKHEPGVDIPSLAWLLVSPDQLAGEATWVCPRTTLGPSLSFAVCQPCEFK